MCLDIELSQKEKDRLLYIVPEIFVGWKVGRYYSKKLELTSLVHLYHFWKEGVNKEDDHSLSKNFPNSSGIYAYAKKTSAEPFIYNTVNVKKVIFPVIIKKENIKKIGYEELDGNKYLTFVCTEVEFSYRFLKDYDLAKKAVEAQLSRTVSGSTKELTELCGRSELCPKR